jgi:hypothetical protein
VAFDSAESQPPQQMKDEVRYEQESRISQTSRG